MRQTSARSYFIRYVILLLIFNMIANFTAFSWVQRMMRQQVFTECERICADMREEVERKKRILSSEVQHLYSSVYNMDFLVNPNNTKQKELQLSVDMINDMGVEQIHVLMLPDDSEKVFNFSRTQNRQSIDRILEEAEAMRPQTERHIPEYGIFDNGDEIWVMMIQPVIHHDYQNLVWEEVGCIIGCISIEKEDFYSVYDSPSSIRISVEDSEKSSQEDNLELKQKKATVYRVLTLNDRKWMVRCDLTFEGFENTYKRFYEIILLLFLFNLFITAVWIRGFQKFFVNPVKEILESIRSAQFHYNTHVSEEFRCREAVDIARYFNDFIERFKQSARDSFQNQQRFYEMELCEKDRAMKALQSQINPHFIYNMLENAKVLASLGKNEEIETVVIKMSEFLRYSLYVDGFSTIDDELRATAAYLEIMDICYDGAFLSEVDVPEELKAVKVPKMILQPLVGNYFKHGLILDGRENRIKIEAAKKEDVIWICVSDNGIGINEERMAKINQDLKQSVFCQKDHGFGLYSINKRIRTIYGEAYGVNLESQENCWTRVCLTIPLNFVQEVKKFSNEERI